MQPLTLDLILGIIVPFVAAVIIKQAWSSRVKDVIALALSLGVGAGIVGWQSYTAGVPISAETLVAFVGAAFIAGKTVYLLMRTNGLTSSIMDWLIENVGNK